MTTLAELKPLLPILQYASDVVGNNSCNDFTIDNTPEAYWSGRVDSYSESIEWVEEELRKLEPQP